MSKPSTDTAEFDAVADLQLRFFGRTPPPIRIDVGALSHCGKVRQNNEDHYAVIRRRRSRTPLLTNLPEGDLPEVHEDAYALVVADGVGGSAFGELASRLALRTAGEYGLSEIKWPLKMDEQEAEEVVEKLKAYAQILDDALAYEAIIDPKLSPMGTTLTAAYTVGPEAFIAHIGDSRAYLHRNNTTLQLTRDHTLAQEWIESGNDFADERQMRQMQRVLTNCLTASGSSSIQVDVLRFHLKDQDRLLLCTDGLSDFVSDAEMSEVLNSQPESQKSCERLVDLALERGGKDNITVIVARYELIDQSSGSVCNDGQQA